jgi:hypothetical protein
MQELDRHIKEELNKRLDAVERHFEADCVFYYGPIFPGVENPFRTLVELLRATKSGLMGNKRLVIFLETPGGSAETVEKLVQIVRYHYDEVFFVVTDQAMSAGTIFCMAGDQIYMDYAASLGPIDPQVHNGKEWVPALGYLDQVERMIEKSRTGNLSDAELLILQTQDLGQLSRFEQAKNLTITLLKTWLVKYKFKDWTVHQTTPDLVGKPVTLREKEKRAEDIAQLLSDNKLWHSHGRFIGMSTLRDLLRLKIEDYSQNEELRAKIRDYSRLLTDYVKRSRNEFFLHSRSYF